MADRKGKIGMTPEQKKWFRAGYKSAIADALDRCRWQTHIQLFPCDKEYNMAVAHCVSAIEPLDVRHAIVREEEAQADG